MDIEAALRFVTENHHGVLATRRRDGATQMSPIACAVDGDTIVISSRETAMKVKHLLREPYAALCVLDDGFYGAWAQIEGPTEIVHLPEAMDGLIAYYRQISGEHPDWDDYRSAMERERRVLIRIRPTRAGPSVSG